MNVPIVILEIHEIYEIATDTKERKKGTTPVRKKKRSIILMK